MTTANFDSLCDEFETAWRSGSCPVIEDYLQRIEEPGRPSLLAELLQIELWWRRDETNASEAANYRKRFSEYREAVETAIRAFNTKTIVGDSQSTMGDEKTTSSQDDRKLLIPVELLQTDRFEIQERLGSGAFGVVWKAYDSQLKRMVAVKVPHPALFDGAVRERFTRESQAAARLNHDGIVSIYDVCHVENDLPAIVSQFIDGPSLAELQIQQRVFDGREAAAMCADLADALLHAHLEGIVHRDLKPANILINTHGKAYVTDFGLAKDLQNEVAVTMEGDVLGTAAYMAPEQAAGLGNEADWRCDIYAIGVILYGMVTGERPFRGTLQMVLQQVINDAPPPPQRLNASVALDLQTIILKCMEKKPEYRYQTAAELRDDLLRFVNYQPILARPPTLFQRFIKWYPSHATDMLGTYFVVAPMTWVFFIAGGLLEARNTEGYQLSSFVFLPWALVWIVVGALILKKGLLFEFLNCLLLLSFMCLPMWLNDNAQSIALVCLISFFGFLLQAGSFVSRYVRQGSSEVSRLASRLSSGENGSSSSR